MSTFLKASDYIGKTFHYLTVISDARLQRHGSKNFYSVICKCKCGNERVYPLYIIKAGRLKSCGCYSREVHAKRWRTHGLAKSHIYGVWFKMVNRCTNEKDEHYNDYGGRGIKVCSYWLKDVSVFSKWAIKNGYKEKLPNEKRNKLEIDRINNNGNYSPRNCRFIARSANMRNTRVNRIIEYKGEKKCFIEWAEHLGISRQILKDRINKLYWPIEKAFTTPPIKKAV
ncbi:MAG: hypothetical protein H0W75_05780 [Chitinophagaceae bacterium]|nr:hypothetical protein [Chitinophagaceae bacterium]